MNPLPESSLVPLLSRTVVQNAFVVNDIEAAMHRWTTVFGVGPFFYNPDVVIPDARYRGEPSTLRFAGALAQAGSVQIELIQQLNDAPSCYRDLFPAGHEGPHHVAIFAADFDQDVARYRAQGFAVAFEGANRGMRFAYLDTSAVLGVMVEILEDVPSVRASFARIREVGDSWDGRDPVRPSAAKLS